jgi:hypothetical protein
VLRRAHARTGVLVGADAPPAVVVESLRARLADEHPDPVAVVVHAEACWWFGLALGSAVLELDVTTELRRVLDDERRRAAALATAVASALGALAPGSTVETAVVRRDVALRRVVRRRHERVWVLDGRPLPARLARRRRPPVVELVRGVHHPLAVPAWW